MNDRGKSTFCIVNSYKACVSTEQANFIYNQVEENQVHRIETYKTRIVQTREKGTTNRTR